MVGAQAHHPRLQALAAPSGLDGGPTPAMTTWTHVPVKLKGGWDKPVA
jgi:hypothetical protein